jgi:hypothetical protein
MRKSRLTLLAVHCIINIAGVRTRVRFLGAGLRLRTITKCEEA